MITICTCTYNRGYLLNRPYESLKKQSNKNFVWLIIDDGSTDNTESIVNNFCENNNGFEIKYYKKKNGGRHTALNYSYQFIDTEFVINLDSDDALLENAVEKIHKYIDNIKKLDNYNKIWQISFRSIDNNSGKLVGKPYDETINQLTGKKQRKAFLKIKGEKHNCRKTKILKENPFPEYEGLKFIPENIVWDVINRKYDSYCTNEVISYYYQNTLDSLSSGNMHSNSMHLSIYYYHIFVCNNLMDEFFFNDLVRKSFITIPKHAILGDIPYKKIMSDLNCRYKKIIISFFYIPVKLLFSK